MASINDIVDKLDKIARGSEGLLAKATSQTLVKFDPMASMKSSGDGVELLPGKQRQPRQVDEPGFAEKIEGISSMVRAMGFGGVSEKLGQVTTAARAASGDPTAIGQLVSQKISGISEGHSQIMGGLTNQNELQGLSGMFGGMNKLFETVTGLPNVFLKMGEVVTGLTDKLKGWTNQLHQSNMQFAEFSASMATVQAQQEVRDIELSIQRGDRRAASAEYLAEGKNRLDKATAPVEDALANFKNWLGGSLANEFAKVIEPVNKILIYLKLVKDDKETPTEFSQHLRVLNNERLTPWHDNEGVPHGRFD